MDFFCCCISLLQPCEIKSGDEKGVESWYVVKSKGKKNNKHKKDDEIGVVDGEGEGTTTGCWKRWKLISSCISSRSKVDTSISGISTHCEHKTGLIQQVNRFIHPKMNAQQSCLSSDRISTLPADVIETILCLLPTKEAARTSILSRDWRYKWTKISKIEFNLESFAISSRRGNIYEKRKLFDAICQVVLLHQGPINDLTLSAFPDNKCVEFNEMILHLSRRNTVEKLRLSYFNKLPLCVFSFHKLTELCLHECYFPHRPTIFDGFGSLTTLHLEYVNISKNTLLHLVSNCELLKSFTLFARYSSDDKSTLIELFECFRVIENVTICVLGVQLKCFRQLPDSRELATSLLHLKYICIKALHVIEKDGYAMPFLLLLIRSTPNFEKLKLQISPLRYDQVQMDPSYASMVDCSDIKLEHLIEFEFEEVFYHFKSELEFVKIILAMSPVLKKVRIILTVKTGFDNEELMMKISRLVFSFPCASTGVKIIIIEKSL